MAKTITALALIKNDIQFVNSATSAGSIQQVPTQDSGTISQDVWAIPVNEGVYSGWRLQPYNPNNSEEATAPSTSAIACCQINSTTSSDWFVVLGTASAYITAGNGGAALSTTWPQVSHTKALLPVCQTLNTTNDDGQYVATLGVPTLTGLEKYFIFGSFNGNALATAFSTGYATVDNLVTWLNANWSTVGTWSKTSDNLTIIATQSNGDGTDVFCGNIIPILVSA